MDKDNKNQLIYTKQAMIAACENGHVSILDWFNNSLYFKCSKRAINYASANGHVLILDWFARVYCTEDKPDHIFKYNKNAINLASENGARRRSRSSPPPPRKML